MSWLKASDPLALLAIQAGQVPNPSRQDGAAGGGRLDTDQRSIEFGEPVPIVFARRRNGAGGILISPGASECRFENNTSNAVTASYLLVLSEGRMDAIPVKDVFQRACRVGSHTQTYNRRAGTWLPGNYIVERDGYDKPEASYICGSIGLYPGMTTLSFQVTIPDGFDQWKRQVHIFIRGGMRVTRLADSVTGPSDNFADLVRWMLINSSRVPSALIDTAAFTSAATFLEANQFRCNCWIQDAQNYSDFIASWAPYFLLGESNVGGKKGLRPLLPINTNGTLKTTAITPEYVFDESLILPGTFEIEYTSWADRQPFVAQMTWRQELEDDAAIIRTAEVRFINTAETGPYESHDLSEFCTTELHAVKVGAYILARRTYVTHTVRFAARPQVHNRILTVGDIVRVKLSRQATGGGQSSHDYLYQVERISKTLAGDVSYECSHFPIDKQGRSILSLLVANATGTGILLNTNATGVGCDINSPTDNTIPTEVFIIPDDEFDPGGFDIGTDVAVDAGEEIVLDDIDIGDIGGGSSGGSGSGGSGSGGGIETPAENPTDSKDATPLGPIQNPVAGQPVDIPAGLCSGGTVYRIAGNIGDEDNAIEEEVDAETGWVIPALPPDALGGSDWNGKFVQFRVACPSGEEQITEPASSIGAFNATTAVFNYYDYGEFDVTVNCAVQYTLTATPCPPFTGSPITDAYVANLSVQMTGRTFFAVTTAAAPSSSPANWLPAGGGPTTGSSCGESGTYRRNGAIITDRGTLFAHNYQASDLWGSNQDLNADKQYSGSHSTTITSIVLRENVAGLGNTGDDITELGLREYVPYPPQS